MGSLNGDVQKRARDSIADAVGTCERIPTEYWYDEERGHTYALNAALRCVEEATKLAIEGLYIDNKINVTDELCDMEIRFSPTFQPQFKSVRDLTDHDEIQNAFQTSMAFFLKDLKTVWHSRAPSGERMFELFETVVKQCVTLPIGYTMVHQMGFTSWYEGAFGEKWASRYGIWTMPLLTKEDTVSRKAMEATINKLDSAHYAVIAKR